MSLKKLFFLIIELLKIIFIIFPEYILVLIIVFIILLFSHFVCTVKDTVVYMIGGNFSGNNNFAKNLIKKLFDKFLQKLEILFDEKME